MGCQKIRGRTCQSTHANRALNTDGLPENPRTHLPELTHIPHTTHIGTPLGKIPCATPKPSQTGIELGWARSAPGAVPPRYERVRHTHLLSPSSILKNQPGCCLSPTMRTTSTLVPLTHISLSLLPSPK